jgi:3-isopropylmalate dehydrogenase
VTCVDKANVLGSLAFFRRIFDEEAVRRAEIEARHAYVDAAALMMVNRPWDFDVVVTENMFGDILSDLAAALVGGLGVAPSADIGDRQAVFQPCHGTAPDIAGQGKANPTAMILSLAMMLDWLGEKHGEADCKAAARAVEAAVAQGYAEGTIRPPEMGGNTGTRAITEAIVEGLRSA